MLHQEQSSEEPTEDNDDGTAILLKENAAKRHTFDTSGAEINVKNVTARWDKKNTEETLENVSLLVQPATLTAIIGPVGSGKSSLIQAILGELKIDAGTIKVNG